MAETDTKTRRMPGRGTPGNGRADRGAAGKGGTAPRKNAPKNALVGEDSADYERTHIPQGRWADTWSLFRSCFGRLVLINLFVLLFCIPSIILMYIGNVYTESLGSVYPFAANVGLGYFAQPETAGLEQSIIMTTDYLYFGLLAVSSLIASVGIAGACYSVKRMINTHGDFTVRGFFRGVRRCYFQVAIPMLIFMIFFYGCVMISDWVRYLSAAGNLNGGAVTAEVFMIIATVVVGFILAWILTAGVCFKTNFRGLMKNSFKLLGGTILSSIFMGGFALLPVWLFWWGLHWTFMLIVSYIIFILIGFTFVLLVWFAFAQWAIDQYNPPVTAKEAEAEANAKKTPKQLEEEAAEQRKQLALELLAAGKSDLIAKPLLPISDRRAVNAVGRKYSREDLRRIAGERQALQTSVNDYIKAHANDPKYAAYNKMFADREKALVDTGDGKKKKKKGGLSSNSLYNNRR